MAWWKDLLQYKHRVGVIHWSVGESVYADGDRQSKYDRALISEITDGDSVETNDGIVATYSCRSSASWKV